MGNSNNINATTINRAIQLLKAGEVVALPTETVYGLAADVMNETAIRKIFFIKSRPINHPLIIHVADISAIAYFADLSNRNINSRFKRLMNAFSPGPLTIILPKRASIADVASGGHNTIALRIAAHPIFQMVVKHFKGLAAPSANHYGHISPTTAAHVNSDFAHRIPLIIDGGACDNGLESTIVNVSDANLAPIIMRPGPISHEAIATCLDEPVHQVANSINESHKAKLLNNLPAVSGYVLHHYAPKKPFIQVNLEFLCEALMLAKRDKKNIALMASEAAATLIMTLPENLRPALMVTTSNEPAAFGKKLYDYMREFDASTASEIWLVLPEKINEAPWAAICDRLAKALTSK